MNAEPSSTTSSPSGSGAAGNQRKERGAIAAQACETCRSRKQRCDEQRPKCGTCQRFKLDCRYREPLPTKKDRTLVEILDRLRIIEGKVDHLGQQNATDPPTPFESSQTGPTRPPAVPAGSSGESLLTTSSLVGPASPRHPSLYKYVSASHKMMAWPVIRQMLDQAQPEVPVIYDSPLAIFEQQGERGFQLPTGGLESLTMDERALLGLGAVGALQLADLDWSTMENLSKAYFDTFNSIHPIMDRQTFLGETLTSVFNDGFDEGAAAALVCLVFALGCVAIADSQNIPVSGYKGRPSGVKGGTVDRPPGLPFFNEARKRLGFAMTENSLGNIQIHALAGLYYESCSRHLEFWRMTMSASIACQALIISNPAELRSPRADLIRRIFWHCFMMETSLNMELELPLSGLEKLEDVVGLPDFSGPLDYLGSQDSHVQAGEHFASQIVLRRLCASFHNNLSNGTGRALQVNEEQMSPIALTRIHHLALSPTSTATPFSPPEQQTSESSLLATVKHLDSQLDQWRGMLPAYLRWTDTRATAFATPVPDLFNQGAIYASGMFTSDLSPPPAPYPYGTDVQVALLRTRYYYAKYLLYRPFVYKALHHGNVVSQEDAKAVAECLRACLKWPIIMSPTCYRKRLIPCLFFWTQNLMGILIILHLSRQVPILSTIRSQFCDGSFDIEAGETVNLSIEWIRDLKEVDHTADWCWQVLKSLYHFQDG